MKNNILLTGIAAFTSAIYGSWYLNSKQKTPEAVSQKVASLGLNKDSSWPENNSNSRFVLSDKSNSYVPDSKITEENQIERGELERVADRNYKSFAEAALKGDKDVLKNFGDVGPSCEWCGKFYEQLNKDLQSPDLDPKQRTAFARAMASSGRVDNIQRLVDNINSASIRREPVGEMTEAIAHIADPTSQNDAGLGASGGNTENTSSGDTVPNDVLDYLSEHINDKNPYLREAVVSALTKEGSLFAAQTLYEHSLLMADIDGYYSEGMGIGAMKPKDEAAVNYLEKLAAERNGLSHLAIKALLNSGVDGLNKVISILKTSPDPEFDRKMMHNAVDRVKLDKNTVDTLESLAKGATQPALQDFASQVINEHQTQINNLNKKFEFNFDFESGAAPPY